MIIHKFRAWIKNEKKMRNVQCLYPVADVFLVNGLSFGPNDAILMESTGMTDMFGTEIYEGDIFMQRFDQRNGKGIDSYGVVRRDPNDGGFIPMSGGDYGLPAGMMEIIGNIYDDPDLQTSGTLEYPVCNMPKYGHGFDETEKAVRSYLKI
jgi:hypothetical protein